MPRLLTVTRLEWRLQLQSAPLWILLLVLVAATSTINPLVMIPGGGDTVGGLVANANSMYALTPSFAIATFFATPFLTAIIAGLGTIRDDDTRLSELLRSTPLRTWEDVLGRCLGIACVLAIAVAGHTIAMALFRELGIGGVTPGPWSFAAYAVPVLVFVLPAVLWMAGVAFAVGALTRRPMAVYALPMLYSVLMFALIWNWRPDGIAPWLDVMLVVLDPSGLRYLTHHLFAVDRGFAHYNSASLPFDALLIANRVMTLAVPAAMVTLTIRRMHAERRVRPLSSPVTPPRVAIRAFAGLRDLAMSSNPPGFLAGTLTVWRTELGGIARQPSLYLFGALLLALIPEAGGAERDAWGGVLLLGAGDVAVRLLPLVTVLVSLYLLFLVTESMHRDRATGFDAIAHATPVATGALLAGRAVAALSVAVLLTLGCGIMAALVLSGQPGGTGSLAPLVLVFGGVMLPTFALWIAFSMLVSSLSRQRTTALALGLGALVLTAAQFISGEMTWLTNWPVLGALRWTDFGTFPIHGPALVANRLLALGLAACGFVAARHCFVRRESDARAGRNRRSGRRMARQTLRFAPLALLPTLTGTFLAVRLQPEVPAMGIATSDAPHTTIQAAVLHVRLEPSAQQMRVQGEYRIVNATASPIPAIEVQLPAGARDVAWQVEGTPAPTSLEDRIPLQRPLAPGDSLRLSFRYAARVPDGFPRNGGEIPNFIHETGVLLSTHRGLVFPRVHHGVDAGFNGGEPFQVRLHVDAPGALLVSAVGDRVHEEERDGRTLSIWTSAVPLHAVTIAAAPYTVTRGEGVAVYHLARHQSSADAIRTTLASARSAYSEWFGALPWRELRVNEHAELFTQATAYPSAIALSEAMGFRTQRGEQGDLAFAVVAHEAAHQWWGHLIRADNGPGSGVLLEGMADYAALRLHGRELGESTRIAFALQLEREFLNGRRVSDEPSLASALEGSDTHEAVLQKKGAWVLWMMHQAVGGPAMDRALRALLASHPPEGSPASLMDLLAAVRREAGDPVAFDGFVAQWIHGVTLPAFAVDSIHCAPDRDGWQCSATVRNVGDGGATVALAGFLGAQRLNGPLPITLAAGRSARVTWHSTEKPDAIVLDPEALLLQRGRARWWLAQ